MSCRPSVILRNGSLQLRWPSKAAAIPPFLEKTFILMGFTWPCGGGDLSADVDGLRWVKLKAAIQENRAGCMQMRLIWVPHSDSAVWIIAESFLGWISSDDILLGKTYKTTDVLGCQNENAEFNKEKSEARRWKGKRGAMLEGSRVSTLRGAFEIYTVTRAQIALAYCTSSWALCLLQRPPHSALPPFLQLTLLFLPFHSHPSKTTKQRAAPSECASPNLTLRHTHKCRGLRHCRGRYQYHQPQ